MFESLNMLMEKACMKSYESIAKALIISNFYM